jgi:hypothetical protein
VVALLLALTLSVVASAFRMELLVLAAALPVAWGIAALLARRDDAEANKAPVSLRWPLPQWTLPIAAVIVAGGVWVVLDVLLTVRHHKMLAILPDRIGWGLHILRVSPWSIVDTLIHTPINEALRVSDGWVVAALFGVVLCQVAPFVRRPVAEGVLLLSGLALVLAFSLTLLLEWTSYRAMHGLVPIAPFVVVWTYAWVAARRSEGAGALRFLTILVVAYLLIGMFAIAATYVEMGRLDVGIEWGQRYLLTLYPILAVLSVLAAYHYWESDRPVWLRKSFVAAVALMTIVAVGFQMRGIGMLYNTRTRLAVWDEALRQEGPIVTDLWWLPSALAALFTEHEVYYVIKRSDVAAWVTAASKHRLRGFTFVSHKPVEPEDLPGAAVRRTTTKPVEIDGLALTRFRMTEDGDR